MKTVLARRGFIGALAALPAIAKAGAAKAGLKPPYNNNMLMAPEALTCSPTPYGVGDKAMLLSDFHALISPENRQRMRSGWQQTSCLDPDLASNRSMSISTVMRIQRERDIDRSIERERHWLERRAKEQFGIDLRSLLHDQP